MDHGMRGATLPGVTYEYCLVEVTPYFAKKLVEMRNSLVDPSTRRQVLKVEN